MGVKLADGVVAVITGAEGGKSNTADSSLSGSDFLNTTLGRRRGLGVSGPNANSERLGPRALTSAILSACRSTRFTRSGVPGGDRETERV